LSLQRRCERGEASWRRLKASDQAVVDQALACWTDLARRHDHARACYCLGFAHEWQRGVKSTPSTAAAKGPHNGAASGSQAGSQAVSQAWYKRAAAKGLAEAQARLGAQRRDGRGPAAQLPSDAEALKLFRKAAAQV
jgi:TPR repeat protein